MPRKRPLSDISDNEQSRNSENSSKNQKLNLNLETISKEKILSLKSDFKIVKHESKNPLNAPGWKKFGDLIHIPTNTRLTHWVVCFNCWFF